MMFDSKDILDVVHENAPSFRLRVLSESRLMERFPGSSGFFENFVNVPLVYEKDLKEYKPNALAGISFREDGDFLVVQGLLSLDKLSTFVEVRDGIDWVVQQAEELSQNGPFSHTKMTLAQASPEHPYKSVFALLVAMVPDTASLAKKLQVFDRVPGPYYVPTMGGVREILHTLGRSFSFYDEERDGAIKFSRQFCPQMSVRADPKNYRLEVAIVPESVVVAFEVSAHCSDGDMLAMERRMRLYDRIFEREGFVVNEYVDMFGCPSSHTSIAKCSAGREFKSKKDLENIIQWLNSFEKVSGFSPFRESPSVGHPVLEEEEVED